MPVIKVSESSLAIAFVTWKTFPMKSVYAAAIIVPHSRSSAFVNVDPVFSRLMLATVHLPTRYLDMQGTH